jgi:phage terminase large subunit
VVTLDDDPPVSSSVTKGLRPPIVVFEPTWWQWEAHKRLRRFSVLVCHRGWGKTILGLNELLVRCDSPGKRYAYIAPYRTQAKVVAWESLKQYAGAIPGTEVSESELRVDLANGGRVQLFGADNLHALRGLHLDGVVLDEYAQMDPQAWPEVIRPAVERKRGMAVFIGTPQGRNHFWELYRYAEAASGAAGAGDWWAESWPATRSGAYTAEQLAALQAEQGDELFRQEYLVSFEAAVRGAYYAKELERARQEERIRSVPWEPMVEVETAWDLGIDDATAIVFLQRVGAEIRIIDYLEARGESIAFYAKALRERPYVYRRHWLPHDAEARELGSGVSVVEQLQRLQIRPTRIVPQIGVESGIQAVRAVFPRLWIDAQKCRRLIDCLGQYRAEWNDAVQEFKPKPRHDYTSHAADALRYACVGIGRTATGGAQRLEPSRISFNPFTHEAQWQLWERQMQGAPMGMLPPARLE